VKADFKASNFEAGAINSAGSYLGAHQRSCQITAAHILRDAARRSPEQSFKAGSS
jgi:hypothetical protein